MGKERERVGKRKQRREERWAVDDQLRWFQKNLSQAADGSAWSLLVWDLCTSLGFSAEMSWTSCFCTEWWLLVAAVAGKPMEVAIVTVGLGQGR